MVTPISLRCQLGQESVVQLAPGHAGLIFGFINCFLHDCSIGMRNLKTEKPRDRCLTISAITWNGMAVKHPQSILASDSAHTNLLAALLSTALHVSHLISKNCFILSSAAKNPFISHAPIFAQDLYNMIFTLFK